MNTFTGEPRLRFGPVSKGHQCVNPPGTIFLDSDRSKGYFNFSGVRAVILQFQSRRPAHAVTH